jgi:DNA replication and repair protein RecF
VRLVRLAASQFRNLALLDLALGASFNVFHGRNAQGKTNLLEAIYLLASLKPLRARRPRDLVQWGHETCAIHGLVRTQHLERKLRVEIDGSRRRAEIDGKVASVEEYFTWVRAIAFQPSDVAIVAGEPAGRRAWLDRAAFTANPTHLAVARTFKRALDQRSAALKNNASDAVLDVIDEQFADAGARLVERRVALLEAIRPHVTDVHLALAAERGRIALAYRTSAAGADLAERIASLRRQLVASRRKERERRSVLVGPQVDDVEISVEDRVARGWSSQGQIRTVVMALKLAELLAARDRGDVPLFLVDDVGSELDRDRKRRLVGLLSDVRAQVFATTTDPDHLADLPTGDTARWRVEGGIVTPG